MEKAETASSARKDTETPRTDKVVDAAIVDNFIPQPLIDHARQLERELAEKNAQLDEALFTAAKLAVPSSTRAKLTEPAQVGNTVFHAGVDESMVIERAKREYNYLQTPEKESARIARSNAAFRGLHCSVALAELVRLKDIKDALDDHAAGVKLLPGDQWFAMNEDYRANKPRAWESARTALTATPPICAPASEPATLRDWAEQVRLTIRGIDLQAERLTERQQTTWRDGEDQAPKDEDFEEVVIGYKLNTGLWHRLLGLLASGPSFAPSAIREQGEKP